MTVLAWILLFAGGLVVLARLVRQGVLSRSGGWTLAAVAFTTLLAAAEDGLDTYQRAYLEAQVHDAVRLAAMVAGGEPAPFVPAAVSARFEEAKDHPAELTAFLRRMPKGGDIHNHVSGAVYAESFIRWAAEDGLCVRIDDVTLVPPPCRPDDDTDAASVAVSEVVAGGPAGAEGITRNDMIDAFSMRNWEIYAQSGHDQFFATFARFGLAGDGHEGDALAELMTRAADENISYLELMTSPGMPQARALAANLAWSDDLAALAGDIDPAGLDAAVETTRRALDDAEAKARGVLGCDAPGKAPPAACAVTVRYLAQVIRVFPAPQVFSQVLFGFRLAKADPRVVGINLVAPEDDPVTLRDYGKQMRMIAFAAAQTPGVPVTLHAGELAMGLVPPEDLRFHIRDAVEIAGAKRIGHGVDVLYEDDARALIDEMAKKKILVEINLTSNDVILGVKGKDHPFETYLDAGVPLTLSTDDEGVSRIDLTHEYTRAARTYDLDYVTLKQLARNSLTYSFLAGASLWQDPVRAEPIQACAADDPAAAPPSGACAAFLKSSDRAQAQWRLERAFAAFEE